MDPLCIELWYTVTAQLRESFSYGATLRNGYYLEYAPVHGIKRFVKLG